MAEDCGIPAAVLMILPPGPDHLKIYSSIFQQNESSHLCGICILICSQIFKLEFDNSCRELVENSLDTESDLYECFSVTNETTGAFVWVQLCRRQKPILNWMFFSLLSARLSFFLPSTPLRTSSSALAAHVWQQSCSMSCKHIAISIMRLSASQTAHWWSSINSP